MKNAPIVSATAGKAFRDVVGRRLFSAGRRKNVKGENSMSSNNNQLNVPQAREAMDRFKMECANEVGVNLKDGYNGELTSRQAGSVGGQMVKKMIESYEQSMK